MTTDQRNPNLDLQMTDPPPASPAPGAAQDWWTGCAPTSGACPGLGPDGILRSLPAPDLALCSREQVRAYFENGWALTELLFSGLASQEAFFRAPYHGLRHPLIFYYGHPAVLYVNKLRLAGLQGEPANADFERVFETGVDEMSWDDMSKNEMEWPSIQVVQAYRRRVHALVAQVIDGHPGLATGHPPITQRDALWALFMGFEHERIHLETSSVLIRELPAGMVRRPGAWPPIHPSTPKTLTASPEPGRDFPDNPLIEQDGGRATIGKPVDWPSYGWDNEYGADVRSVAPFQVSRCLVSNGEFYEFVRTAAYQERAHWSETGWRWRSFRNAKWPTFWVSDGPSGLHHYRLRTIFEVVPMPWSWPVLVNFHEAQAYAQWRSRRDGRPYRLITEAEHRLLRDAERSQDSQRQRPGEGLPDRTGVNLELTWGSESPVDALPPSPSGVHDTMGNVWKWCEDDFHALPGFEVHPLYDDFSTPCFDGEHSMILGGSFASTGDEASTWARFHFRPHFFQHAGFYLASSEEGAAGGSVVRLSGALRNKYETDRMIEQYMTLHYGSPEDAMAFACGPREAAEFPRRCAEWLIETAHHLGLATERALDIGCAVGRSSFELARHYRHVLGIDLSQRFIEICRRLAGEGGLDYTLRVEGALTEPRRAIIDPAIDRTRVSFRRADAGALPAELMDFDAVFLGNLICRMPSPRACLTRLGGSRGLVKPGGLLLITSPFTWMEETTPKSSWLGGFEQSGRVQRSPDGLRTTLGAEFELIEGRDMSLVIREHERKYEYIVAHAMLWRRRG